MARWPIVALMVALVCTMVAAQNQRPPRQGQRPPPPGNRPPPPGQRPPPPGQRPSPPGQRPPPPGHPAQWHRRPCQNDENCGPGICTDGKCDTSPFAAACEVTNDNGEMLKTRDCGSKETCGPQELRQNYDSQDLIFKFCNQARHSNRPNPEL